MRSISATAVCASAVISVALLVGCSNVSQPTQALPGSASTATATLSEGAPHYLHPNGRVGPISAVRLLKLQVEGKLPAPAAPEVMARILKQITTRPRPHINIHGNTAAVVIWAVNSNSGYLTGQKKNGRKTISSIDAAVVRPPPCGPAGGAA